MTEMNAESTVEATLVLERMVHSYSVKVQNYHSDNEFFDTKLFRTAVAKANQTLSLCVINSHHQNNTAGYRIKDVTTNAHTSILHLAHR